MIVNGRDIKFVYNVLASIEVAGICPEGKLENIAALFGGSYAENVENTNKFMIALHRGYIETMKYKDPSFSDTLLTEEELLHMETKDYLKLQDDAIAAYMGDQKRTVKTEPIKQKSGKKTDKSSLSA